ncbi:MAG: hypothetical protein N2322_06765, partial [Terrimicrobiaceae bacterium]|nr:hypothetical protein [Terrimicrobiaceae bacterium]
ERMVFEFDSHARGRENLRQKRAIAAAARRLIEPGQRVILDTGTTTFQLALLLADCRGCTVITPSLAVASALQFAASVEVILLGGKLHRGSPDLTGAVTEHCLEIFAADWAFQGTEGIGEDGRIYNLDPQFARVERLMRERAERRCLLADCSKIGRTALVVSGSLRDFDVFITGKEAPSGFLRAAAEQAGRLILV